MNCLYIFRHKFITFILVMITGVVYSQQAVEKKIRAIDPQPASKEQMQWFRDARYGLFLHWGPGCMSGLELSWGRRGPRPYDVQGHMEEEKTMRMDVYDNLYKSFNPTKFNADKWVQIAKDAGMKYIVFTSKHHDGFSNFYTKYSDYNITNTEFGRDIVKELADACHKEGMRFGIYYSVRDWYHPDYLQGDNSKYREFYTGQLRELLTKYGKVDILWFDSTFGPEEMWDFQGVLKMIFSLQPEILINDRYGKGWAGDYYTPEQQLGAFDRTRPWESCATFVDGQWSYRPNGIMYTLQETLGLLLGAVGGDGNLLLNIGPMPTGKIEERQAERLKEAGGWLAKYGEGVYGTRGGPYISGHWGYSTLKGNAIYLFLNPWDPPELILPDPGAKVLSYELLSGGKMKLTSGNGSLSIEVPQEFRKEPFTVIRILVGGNALDIQPVKVPSSGSLTIGKKVSSGSNGMYRFWWHNPCGEHQAVDDNPNTRWRASEGSSTGWLEVNFGVDQSFEKCLVMADENTEEFAIQIPADEKWLTVYQGKRTGDRQQISFQPVTASRVRLKILSAKDTPSVWEFRIY